MLLNTKYYEPLFIIEKKTFSNQYTESTIAMGEEIEQKIRITFQH